MTGVEVTLPRALFDGNTRGLISHLGLHGRHLGGERWSVRANSDQLVTSGDLANETGLAYAFDRVSAIPESSTFHPTSELADRFEHQRTILQSRMVNGDIAALFHQIQLNVITAPHANLSDIVRDAYEGIGRMPIESTGQSAFPNRSAQLVAASDTLIRRVRLPGILFRFAQDPDAIRTLTAAVQTGGTERPVLFGSSTDWYHNIIGVVHYLGPLLGCLAPRFWCLPATRVTAVVLFSLGLDVNGFDNIPVEQMQLLPTAGRTDPVPRIEAPSEAWAQSIHWWTFRLNQMFAYLSDPATFGDANGVYVPHAHQHWMLTFGEAFGLMASVQSAGRDVTAQRVLMNTLLDLTERITGADFDRLCTLSYAEKRAAHIREKMPKSAAAVLMPAADRAIAALAQIQQGFFVRRLRGEANVVLHLPDGSVEEKSPERSVAMLLKLFRNATHGFGGKSEAAHKSEVDAALLAQFDGRMPNDIVLLPYLYLLDVLCNPERVRESISRRVAV